MSLMKSYGLGAYMQEEENAKKKESMLLCP
jgi:hypothetical protein